MGLSVGAKGGEGARVGIDSSRNAFQAKVQQQAARAMHAGQTNVGTSAVTGQWARILMAHAA